MFSVVSVCCNGVSVVSVNFMFTVVVVDDDDDDDDDDGG